MKCAKEQLVKNYPDLGVYRNQAQSPSGYHFRFCGVITETNTGQVSRVTFRSLKPFLLPSIITAVSDV